MEYTKYTKEMREFIRTKRDVDKLSFDDITKLLNEKYEGVNFRKRNVYSVYRKEVKDGLAPKYDDDCIDKVINVYAHTGIIESTIDNLFRFYGMDLSRYVVNNIVAENFCKVAEIHRAYIDTLKEKILSGDYVLDIIRVNFKLGDINISDYMLEVLLDKAVKELLCEYLDTLSNGNPGLFISRYGRVFSSIKKALN